MSKSNKWIALMLVVTMLAGSVSVPNAKVEAKEKTKEYVVLAKNDKGYNKAEEVCEVAETEPEIAGELEDNHIIVGEMTETEAETLEKDKDIVLVEEDILFEASDFEDETFEDVFGAELGLEEEKEMKLFLKELNGKEDAAVAVENQWNIDAVNANEKEFEEGTEKIKVAVIDTGVTASEDIEVAGRVNLIEGEEDVNPLYEDVSGHGTSVASVIAAKDNGMGVTGINPNVELYSVKALYDDKTTSLSKVVQGIYWCMENGIDIINMSFGTSAKSDILEQVIKEADAKGILMIAAAGNQGKGIESTVEYPAAFEEVIAVGAINSKGKMSDISSAGKELELMAPGEDIPATGYFDEIIKTDGTSMAAPHVAGVASVLWAKDRSKSSKFIRDLLKASAKPMGKNANNGVVDLEYALSVYDKFAKKYKEDGTKKSKLVELNKEKVEQFDDEEVNASWSWSNHQSAVGLYDETSAAALNVMKIGAKISDTESYLKYSAGSTDSFHGHYNYIANYMYVMRMARICFNEGMSQALATAKYPCTGAGEAQIYNGIVELNKHWSTVLSGQTISNSNKARILVGIATHIAMDTYAHKAYTKAADGTWTVHIAGANQDTTSYVSNRWTCAKSIAYDIVDVWHYGLRPDAVEYYQPDHSNSKFRLFKLSTYCNSADKDTYTSEKTWYDNRTAD